jgi:fructosamine-3-kinase
MQNFEKILSRKIKNITPLGGGCIASVLKIITDDNQIFVAKEYSAGKGNIIRNEANGLIELAKAEAIRIPKVIYFDEKTLITEYIGSGRKSITFFEYFGRKFARMHRYTSDEYGFIENNFIGDNPQKNLPKSADWCEFYFNNRLLYQIELTQKNGYLSDELKQNFSQLENKIDKILSDNGEKPSLLHGDLWGGNYLVDENGDPCLIDPAVYYGNREADLAMTKLFGGFSPEFYSAYNEEYPLPPGYNYRENIYKLYHILNHLNLFGTGYYHQSLSLIKSYL